LKKRAFSLVELLVVVVIIGVVYTLSISSFKKNTLEEQVSFMNIKKFLKRFDYQKNISLVCLDKSTKCDIYVDGNKTKTIDSFIDSEVSIYRYDFNYGYVQKEFDIFFDDEDRDEDVLFAFTLDKKGVPDQILVEYNDRYYDMSSYFDNVKEFASIDAAEDFKKDLQMDVMR
jgi:prepilin-type N-terminal cleavage/methylation domain-containing protein